MDGRSGPYGDRPRTLFAATRASRTLVVSGEIDLSNAESFEVAMVTAVDDGVRTIDFSGVGFVSAAGVRALAIALVRVAEAGETLTVADPIPSVRRVLVLCNLTQHTALRLTP